MARNRKSFRPAYDLLHDFECTKNLWRFSQARSQLTVLFELLQPISSLLVILMSCKSKVTVRVPHVTTSQWWHSQFCWFLGACEWALINLVSNDVSPSLSLSQAALVHFHSTMFIVPLTLLRGADSVFLKLTIQNICCYFRRLKFLFASSSPLPHGRVDINTDPVLIQIGNLFCIRACQLTADRVQARLLKSMFHYRPTHHRCSTTRYPSMFTHYCLCRVHGRRFCSDTRRSDGQGGGPAGLDDTIEISWPNRPGYLLQAFLEKAFPSIRRSWGNSLASQSH